MANRLFRFVDPESGEEITANWLTEQDYQQRCRMRDENGKEVYRYRFILEVTQWGFDSQKSIVVAKNKIDQACIAFKIETMFDEDTLESVLDLRAGQRPV